MATLKQLIRDLDRVNKGLMKVYEAAPRMAGVEGVRWVNKNFDTQSWKGRKWQPRSPKTNAKYDSRSGVKGSVFNSKNPILRQTGNLKDSIRHREIGRVSYIGFDTNRVPYGIIHNEGGTIHIRLGARTLYFRNGRFAAKKAGQRRKKVDIGHTNVTIKMPQRQFMPKPNQSPDPDLLATVSKKIDFENQKVLSIFKK